MLHQCHTHVNITVYTHVQTNVYTHVYTDVFTCMLTHTHQQWESATLLHCNHGDEKNLSNGGHHPFL